MAPNDAAASLSFATSLSDGMIAPQDAPEGEPAPGMAVEDTGKATEQPAPSSDMASQIGTAVREAVRAEMDGLRSDIKDALNDDAGDEKE